MQLPQRLCRILHTANPRRLCVASLSLFFSTSGLVHANTYESAPVVIREFRDAPWDFHHNYDTEFGGTITLPENGGLPVTFTFADPVSGVDVDGANQSDPDDGSGTASNFGASYEDVGEYSGFEGIGIGHTTTARFDRGDQFTFTASEPISIKYIRIDNRRSGQYLHIEWQENGVEQSELLDMDDHVSGFLEPTSTIEVDANTPVRITNASDNLSSNLDRMRFAGMIITVLLDEEPTYDTIGAADGFTQMVGVNLAGADSTGNNNLPGTYGFDYIYPSEDDFDYFHSKGLDLIRLPFKWERLQRTLSSSLHSAELQRIDDVVAMAEARGMKVILDMHNYGSYDGNGIGSTAVTLSDFTDVWSRIADYFEGRSGIYGYGLMNEPVSEVAAWSDVADAGIAAVRQHDSDVWVIVSGDGWAPTRNWRKNGNVELHENLNNIDSKVMFEAHSYIDSNSDGQDWGSYAAENGHPMKGVWRDYPFVNWLRQNNFYGYVGEFGVPETAQWIEALENQIHQLGANGVSATYWIAGPWSGGDEITIQPTNNYTTDRLQMSVMEQGWALRGPGSSDDPGMAIARYNFENSSALGEDTSGSSTTHDGTATNVFLDTSDAVVGASSLSFNGSSYSYITVSDHAELDDTDQLSIAFWAKPTASALDGTPRGIISKRSGYNNNIAYSLYLSNNGELFIYLDEGSSAPHQISTGHVLQADWQHIALVFDGNQSSSNRVRLYVNGTLVNTFSHNTSSIRNLSSPLIVGSLNEYFSYNGNPASFDGNLDDIYIHRTALSASDVTTLYDMGVVDDGDPIAYYNFENSSNLGDDTSTNGLPHDGSVNGSPSQDNAESRMGTSSIRMHGHLNHYIEVADDAELDDADELTVAFWAKPTSTTIDGNPRGIISKRNGFNDNVSYSLYAHTSGELNLYLDEGDNSPNAIPTGYTLQTNWQHIAMVFDGSESASNRVKLYVDGVLYGTYSHSATSIRDLNAPLTIGSLNPDFSISGSYLSYDGWLDDVRIYRRALSAGEVANLNGVSADAFWSFDEGSGSTVGDSSANNLDIALQGSYSWTSGQVGGALDLGGQATSYGTLSDPDKLENTDKLSIVFWVRPENIDGNARFLVSKRDAQDVNAAYSIFFWSGNRLFVDLNKNSNSNRHNTSTQFQNDTWYHVAVVYDGTLPQAERGRVYINGDLDANSPFSVSSANIPDYPSDFFLGIANSGYVRTFGGRIDDLFIYREALFESEVEDLGGF